MGRFSHPPFAWEDKPMSALVGIVIIVVILWAVRAVIRFY
jgi:hypothetical protein